MALRRKAVPQAARAQFIQKPFVAPTRGWVSATNLAAAPDGAAQILENWFPTTTGIKMRGGSRKHATASDAGEPLESGMSYVGGTTRKMFGASDGNIIELTTVADPDVEPAAIVTGQTSDYYSHTNFSTTGGNYLYAVNGTDLAQLYDGTNFYPVDNTILYELDYDAEVAAFTVGETLTGGTSGATATIVKVIDNGTTGTLWINNVSGTFQNNEALTDSATGSATADGVVAVLIGAVTGIATSALSHVNPYKKRLFFVESGTLSIWYLPVDSITGALSEFPLTGVFTKGGAVLFTATWSLDSGDGLDDKMVIVTTEGEIAVYQGSNPGDADDWGLVGLYESSPPLGKNAYLKVGGDLLILTKIGLIPLTQIINKDPAALALAAVSRNIQPDWQAEATQRSAMPWEIVKWTSRNIAFVTCPVTSDESITPAICFAVNLETGAWSKVTGWNTRCFILHDDQVYFGTNDGLLMQADVGGTDNGALIYYTYAGHNDHLGRLGQTKTVRQVRAVFRTKVDFIPKLSVSTDYAIELPAYPDAAVISDAPGEWDAGLWDVAKWDTGLSYYVVQTLWVSVGRTGFTHIPQLQIVSGSETAPSAELVVFEALYEPAGFAV